MAYIDKTNKLLLFAKYSLVWLAGALIFYMRNASVFCSALKGKRVRTALISVMAMLAGTSVYYMLDAIKARVSQDLSWFTIFIGLSFCMYLYLYFYNATKRGLLTNLFNYCSRFSYTLYLMRFPFFIIIFDFFQADIQGEAPILALLLAMAVLIVVVPLAALVAMPLENKEFFASRLRGALGVRSLSS